MHSFQNDISIVIGGSAGQGIQTVESLLMRAFKSEGYHVFASKEYMSRIRGGSNSTEIRVTSNRVDAYVHRVDILFALDEGILGHMVERISEQTIILTDTSVLKKKYPKYRMLHVPFAKMAKGFGGPVLGNAVAVGVVAGIAGVEWNGLERAIEYMFGRKGMAIVRQNVGASEVGYKFGRHAAFMEKIDVRIAKRKDARKNKELLISGNDAIGMGAIAGGCDYIGSYPMSPGTGVLTFLAQQSKNFGIAVEQVEDEIAAINMGLGASYAGARAMVTTSGGGFALMQEGVSLSGMTETPIVIHIGMRPGPATGLPTRTAQEDLNLALYSGHGEFPRAIFAPGDIAEAFEVMQKAFHVADTAQVPVFVLTDQYFLDCIVSVPEKDLKRAQIKKEIIETNEDYKRYALTKNGISPRGIPGFGQGLVNVDSDEHTEDGHITESFDIRIAMQEKRFKKMETIRKECLKPVLSGNAKSKTLLVGWGSTKNVFAEAAKEADVAAMHFKQVWPLPKNLAKSFATYKKIVVAEHNATGQFAQLLKNEGVKVTATILKSDGRPFDATEIVEKLKMM